MTTASPMTVEVRKDVSHRTTRNPALEISGLPGHAGMLPAPQLLKKAVQLTFVVGWYVPCCKNH